MFPNGRATIPRSSTISALQTPICGIWTKDLSEDWQALLVTLTRADVVLTLSCSLQTSQITEVSTRRKGGLQSVTGDSDTIYDIGQEYGAG